MKKLAGLWIDHNKAIIVVIKNGVESTREIVSYIKEEDYLPSVSHSPSSTDANGTPAEIKPTQKILNLIYRYYDEIISYISDADSIWIFGPGKPKARLENRLKQKGFGARIVGIEAVGKMNDQQISAVVREHFLRKRNAWELSQDLKTDNRKK